MRFSSLQERAFLLVFTNLVLQMLYGLRNVLFDLHSERHALGAHLLTTRLVLVDSRELLTEVGCLLLPSWSGRFLGLPVFLTFEQGVLFEF